MRRSGVVVLLALLAFLGMLAPPAQAQAPAPKVTINGLIDVVTFAGSNMGIWDGDFTRGSDDEWRSRQRGIVTFTGEVGKVKGVFALETDFGWGMVTTNSTGSALAGGGATQPANIAFLDANAGSGVDILNALEIKNLYIEFPLEFAPWPTTARLGAQPYNLTYKLGVLGFTDMPGASLVTTFTPALRGNFFYAQLDEAGPGNAGRARGRGITVPALQGPNTRGEDFTIAVSIDVTPWKGLDLRPIYSYLFTDSGFVSSVNNSGIGLQVNRGGLGGDNVGSSPTRNGFVWNRHYFGIDARWRSGPWGVEPTFIYMTGAREVRSSASNKFIQQTNSWLADLRGEYNVGPLSLGGLAMVTPGNRVRDNLLTARTYRSYHPISNEGAYMGGWTDFFASNSVDYLMTPIAFGGSTSSAIGFDQYGRWALAFRPIYTVTPTLQLTGRASANWTVEEVDIDGTDSILTGRTPAGDRKGEERYVGTDVSLQLTWTLSPGLAFDVMGGVLFTGDALRQCKAALVAGVCQAGRGDVQDSYASAARLRFSF